MIPGIALGISLGVVSTTEEFLQVSFLTLEDGTLLTLEDGTTLLTI